MAIETNKSVIAEWYNNKSVFVTGGSGFMGKVLVEKLLYSCSGIKNIFILMRVKRGKDPAQRIKDMWTLPLFDRLRKSQPEAINKIIPLNGELNSEGLGLNEDDLDKLINSANIVFHCAATLKLEATLKDAVEQNVEGTARVIDVAKKIRNLLVFVHFSTAFCSADVDVFEEKVYKCGDNPRHVIDVLKWMNEDAIKIATPFVIAPHPNTYTYSKRLAEELVAQESINMNVCIVRPSIVCPAFLEPLPGWVDSLNGPMGLLVGAGKGVIRSMHGKAENRAQVIPVDIAINAAIAIAQKVSSNTTRSKEVPVYNLTNDDVMPITMGQIIEKGRAIVHDNPFEGQIWYPDGDFRSSKLVHNIYVIFFHWLPAFLIDFLLFLFRYKTFMVRLQRKIHDGLELLQFFTVRPWIFRCSNFLNLKNDMTEEDLKIFPTDITVINMDEYMKMCILGARQYLMKEDLSSLPKCRIKQKFLFVIHKVFVFSMYLFLIWTVMSISPIIKKMFDLAGKQVHQLPLVGTLIPTK